MTASSCLVDGSRMNRKKSRETNLSGYRRRNQVAKRYRLGQVLCTEEIPWYFTGRNVDAVLQNFLMSRYVTVTIIFVTNSHG
jgi:hypothetical protein